MSAARPTLHERLQARIAQLEQENAHLRRLDTTMQLRMQTAVRDADAARRVCAQLQKDRAELTGQLGVRSTQLEAAKAELAAARAELNVERAPRGAGVGPAIGPAVSQVALLEVD